MCRRDRNATNEPAENYGHGTRSRDRFIRRQSKDTVFVFPGGNFANVPRTMGWRVEKEILRFRRAGSRPVRVDERTRRRVAKITGGKRRRRRLCKIAVPISGDRIRWHTAVFNRLFVQTPETLGAR